MQSKTTRKQRKQIAPVVAIVVIAVVLVGAIALFIIQTRPKTKSKLPSVIPGTNLTVKEAEALHLDKLTPEERRKKVMELRQKALEGMAQTRATLPAQTGKAPR